MRGGTRLILGLMIGTLVASVVACSDDGPKLQTSDKPEQIVSYAISSLGPATAKLPADRARPLVIASMASVGIPATEANCVIDHGIPIVGGEAAFSTMTVRQLVRFQKTAENAAEAAKNDAGKAALDACVSPESTARGKAKQLAPDFDAATARDLAAQGAEAEAVAVGLTPSEAKCYADGAFRHVPLDTVKQLVAGTAPAGTHDTGKVVKRCLTTARLDELAPKLEKKLLAEQAQRNKEQQQLQQEINNAIESSTTIAGQTLPSLPTMSTTTQP